MPITTSGHTNERPRLRTSNMKIHCITLTLATATLVAISGCRSNKKDDVSYRTAPGQGAAGLPEDAKFEQAKDPTITADTQFAAGQLAESQGDFNTALLRYDQALKEDPKHLSALYRSAAVYTTLKQYPAAIGRWYRYVEASDGSATSYNNLALTYELAGKAKEAEVNFKRGIEKYPQDEVLRVNFGLMLARLGRVDDAQAELKHVLDPAKVAYNLAAVYEEMGNMSEARKHYREALSINPQLIDAQSRLAALD